jgi:pyruvate-formate lyase-activating enzyme
VTPNKNIFCNTPWYELHIYWDGGLGICCQEEHRLYQQLNQDYNIARMTIVEWFNSEPVKKFRTDILQNKRLSLCKSCYVEEDLGGNSRRIRSNQKSVIFTRAAFDESFLQSPGYPSFAHSQQHSGETDTHPIDLHVDLGNYCNLACKMCNAQASSTIASQEVRWGIDASRQYLGSNWTQDDGVWNSFKQQLLAIPRLNNIHFMGGETLLTDRLEDLVDTFLEHRRQDVCMSFVTNGTVFSANLLNKLRQFRRVGIEISIETVTDHNAYQRQGTDTDQVLSNIEKYLTHCNGTSITLALRPVPSVLSIGYYDTLLRYALKKQLIVKSSLCYDPAFLDPKILPAEIKQQYLEKYQQLLADLDQISVPEDYNASDPNNYQSVIKEQAQMCVSILQSPTRTDSEHQLELMVRHCERWDRVYGLDARILYPEFQTILDRHGYSISS